MVFLPQVHIAYFPPSATSASGPLPTITPAPSPALVNRRLGRRNATLEDVDVQNGYTFSNPSMYVLMPSGIHVTDSCGTLGSSLASGTVPMATGALSTISYNMPVGAHISDNPGVGYTTKPLAASDLAHPTWGLSGPWNDRPDASPLLGVGAPELNIPAAQTLGASTTAVIGVQPDDTVIGPPWYPIIVLPEEVLSLHPAWEGCRGRLMNPSFPIFDPPKPLQAQAVMVSQPASPAAAQAAITTSAGVAHPQMLNLAPPAPSTQPLPTSTDPAQAPAASPVVAAASPAAASPAVVNNNAPAASPAQPAASPAQQVPDPAASPVNMAQLQSALAVPSPAAQVAAAPAGSPAAGSPQNVAAPSALPAGVSPVAVASEVPAAGGSTGGSIGGAINSAIGGPTGGSNGGSPSGSTGGSNSNTGANSPAQAGSGSGSTPATGGNTGTGSNAAAKAPAFQGEGGAALPASANLNAAGVNVASAASPAGAGAGVPAGAGTTPAPAPPAVINVGGSSITADSSSNFVVNSQTLNQNNPITVDNTPISILPGSSAVAIGLQTQQIAQPSPAPAAPVLTVGGTPYTADTSSNFVINGQTLNPSNAITVSNTPISLLPGNTAAAVGSSTQALIYATPPANANNANSPAQGTPALTVDGTSYRPTGPSSAYVIAGQTLTPGAQITVGNTPVSLASNGQVAVVGSSTQNLQPAATPAQGPALTFGGSTYQPTGPSSAYVIGSQTITPGAGPITVSGTPISVASNGATAVIGSSTQNLGSAITPEPEAFTVGGQTITADASSLLVGGATMTVGQSTTISGTPVVLNPSGTIKIGTSEIPLPTGGASGGQGPSSHHFTGKATKMSGMSKMSMLVPIFVASLLFIM